MPVNEANGELIRREFEEVWNGGNLYLCRRDLYHGLHRSQHHTGHRGAGGSEAVHWHIPVSLSGR